MSNFLDKFKTKIVKKKEGIFVKGKDLEEFQDYILENEAWLEAIRENLVTAAKAKHNSKTKIMLYWKKIASKYGLDEHKNYSMDSETGELTLAKSQPIKKEVKE